MAIRKLIVGITLAHEHGSEWFELRSKKRRGNSNDFRHAKCGFRMIFKVGLRQCQSGYQGSVNFLQLLPKERFCFALVAECE